MKIEESGGGPTNRFAYEAIPVTDQQGHQTLPSAEDRRAGQLATLSSLSSGLDRPRLLRRMPQALARRGQVESVSALFHSKTPRILAMWRAALDILRSPYERRWIYSLLTIGIMG